MRDVVIVGGGAAGLWAAIVAARGGRDVLVLEKTARLGTKILASGGTRCNLTTSLPEDRAAAAFGHRGAKFLKTAFRTLPPEQVRARFAALGVPTAVEPELEKVFPKSGRAVDVRDALVKEALAAGVTLRTNVPVEAVAAGSSNQADWKVRARGETVVCQTLMLCPGGRSYPKTGTTGDGYTWLTELGLPLVTPVPALTPLLSDAGWVHELAGVTLANVRVKLVSGTGKVLAERRRPLLFTHRGVSGPAPMDLSEPVARSEVDGVRVDHSLGIDLLPDRDWDELREELVQATREDPSRLSSKWLPDDTPRRVRQALATHLGWPSGWPRLHEMTRQQRNRFVNAMKGWPVPLSGTRGWDHAEVTAGGLALDAVDPGSMRVKACKGLYVFGELLDLQGPIGGFNFQSAFACAELAGRHAAGQG